ncbi:MAG: radical SAM protein [bacterium]
MSRSVLYLNPPLLVPPEPLDYPPFASLGALHGAAALRRLGARVTLIDSFVMAAPESVDGWLRLGPPVEQVLKELPPADVVVIHHAPWARLERNLREVLEPLLQGLRGRPALVLADGCLGETHYVSLDPGWLFERFPALDHWAAREPELPLSALLRGERHPRLYSRGELLVAGSDAQVEAWELELGRQDVERYVEWLGHEALRDLLHGRSGRGIFPYVASRGCPFRCAFCTSERGRPWVGLPLAQVRDELSRLKDGGVRELWLLDAIANANQRRFRELLELLHELELRVSIPNGLRIDRLGEPELRRLAQCADRVPVSVESADEAVLASLGKKLSLQDARSTLKLASSVGLLTQVHLLIGAPGESSEAANQTLAFAAEAQTRWGAEPLLQYYVDPRRLAIPTADGLGLPDDFYEAFHERPAPLEGALAPERLQRFMDTFRRKRSEPRQSKLIVNLSYRCNNRCVFCSVGDRERVDGRLEDQLAALEEAASQGVTLLDLDGGEPTLYPELLAVIDRARELGFERITVTSNGRMLSYENLAASLARRGVDLLISLHGPTAEVHDGLTRTESSFEQTCAGLRRAREVFRHVGVNTTVVRQNLEHLDALAALLVQERVDVWNVQLLTPFGTAIGRADLAPDWEEAVTALRRLLSGWAEQLKIQIVGLPLCGLEELERHGLDDHHKAVRRMRFVDGAEVNLADYLNERRAHTEICHACERLQLCGGFWDFETPFEDRHREGPGPHRAPPELPPKLPNDARVRMLDIIPGYACNVVCDYCSVTEQMRKVNLAFDEILPLLRQGREQSIDYVSFGGGEPTIRPDILRLIRAARDLGYETVRVQTNGFMFAYPEFVERAVDAGLNRVHVSFMTCREELYDRITGFEGSRKIVLQALENLARYDVEVRGDLILKADTYEHVADTVAYFHERGVRTFYLWLVSLTDRNRDNVESLRRISELRPAVERALDYGRDRGIEVWSRHIPSCLLPNHADRVVRLGDEDVWVVTPESSFWLLESVISANRFAPRCEGCSRRGVCWGLRQDYLDRYGDDELEPYP